MLNASWRLFAFCLTCRQVLLRLDANVTQTVAYHGALHGVFEIHGSFCQNSNLIGDRASQNKKNDLLWTGSTEENEHVWKSFLHLPFTPFTICYWQKLWQLHIHLQWHSSRLSSCFCSVKRSNISPAKSNMVAHKSRNAEHGWEAARPALSGGLICFC